MGDTPQMRAAVTKDFVDGLDGIEPDLRARVEGRLSAEARETIERELRIGWIPLAVHAAVGEATRAEIGLDGYRRAWRVAMSRIFEQPILKPLVQGAIHVFGLTPMSMVKMTPKAWPLLVRGGSQAACLTNGGAEARIELTGFPPELSETGTWQAGMAGVWESFFDVTRMSGTVAIVDDDPATGRSAYRIVWSPGAKT